MPTEQWIKETAEILKELRESPVTKALIKADVFSNHKIKNPMNNDKSVRPIGAEIPTNADHLQPVTKVDNPFHEIGLQVYDIPDKTLKALADLDIDKIIAEAKRLIELAEKIYPVLKWLYKLITGADKKEVTREQRIEFLQRAITTAEIRNYKSKNK